MKRRSFTKFFILIFLSLQIQGLERSYFLGEKFETARRNVAIIASDSGFYPKRPMVFVGEKVTIYITSTTERPSCLIIKGKEVYLEAQRGEVSKGEVFFQNPGIYEFHCPASGHKGEFVVLEHPRDKRSRIQRNLASKMSKRVKIWRPRDD